MTTWQEKIDKYGNMKICTSLKCEGYRVATAEFSEVMNRLEKESPEFFREVLRALDGLWNEFLRPITSSNIRNGEVVEVVVIPSPFLVCTTTLIQAFHNIIKMGGSFHNAATNNSNGGESNGENSGKTPSEIP